MAVGNKGEKLIREIKADRSNRGKSPKSANVTSYATRAVELETRVELTKLLAQNQDIGCKKVAAQILSLGVLPKTKALQQTAIRLMKDQSWELREYAPRALMGVMKTGQFVDWLYKNVDSNNNYIRRAIAIGARNLLAETPTRADGIKILITLATDTDKYVTDAVSPFSLGDQLFRMDRATAEKTVARLSKMKSSQARRNAAAALQCASARPLSDGSVQVLITLLSDENDSVLRSAKKALSLALQDSRLNEESFALLTPYSTVT